MRWLAEAGNCSLRTRYGSTNLLVKQHGEDAPIEAAMRADAMLEKGHVDGYAEWRRSCARARRAAPSPERVTTGLPKPPTIQRTKCGEEHPRAATGLHGVSPHALPVAVARPPPAHPGAY